MIDRLAILVYRIAVAIDTVGDAIRAIHAAGDIRTTNPEG